MIPAGRDTPQCLQTEAWVYTDRVWEDALITIAHARSAWAGLGLIHHPGEAAPVHGFTSALSVLIPLIGYPLGLEMTLLRLSSVVGGALTVLLAYGCARMELRWGGLVHWYDGHFYVLRRQPR
jgi:hypothetical protein